MTTSSSPERSCRANWFDPDDRATSRVPSPKMAAHPALPKPWRSRWRSAIVPPCPNRAKRVIGPHRIPLCLRFPRTIWVDRRYRGRRTAFHDRAGSPARDQCRKPRRSRTSRTTLSLLSVRGVFVRPARATGQAPSRHVAVPDQHNGPVRRQTQRAPARGGGAPDQPPGAAQGLHGAEDDAGRQRAQAVARKAHIHRAALRLRRGILKRNRRARLRPQSGAVAIRPRACDARGVKSVRRSRTATRSLRTPRKSPP